jgi:hypothetical protein
LIQRINRQTSVLEIDRNELLHYWLVNYYKIDLLRSYPIIATYSLMYALYEDGYLLAQVNKTQYRMCFYGLYAVALNESFML